VDLLFLDINMPKLTGIELAKTLLPRQKIIFTTAYSEYAVESYELNAVDYLLKPITFDRFIKSVNKTLEFFKVTEEDQSIVMPPQQEQYVFIKSGKAIIQIFFDQIWFIEGLKDYVTFHTPGGKHIVYKRMKDLEAILPSDFLRVHNSYIVNQKRIQKIEDHLVYTEGGQIPVSEKYRDAFYACIGRKIL
jgi:DNA-binding LytR/AlgR family response regulator